MFINGDVEDEVSEVAETSSNESASTTHLHVTKDSWQSKFVWLGTGHVAPFNHSTKLLNPAGWLGPLYDVAVGAHNYYWRVGCTSLHTDAQTDSRT